MLLDQATSQQAAHRFFARVRAQRMVWGLLTPDDDWAIVRSQDDEQIKVMPFWSDRAYAKRCAKAEWWDYRPACMHLDEFVRAWLPGMHDDGMLVGLNWNSDLCGEELDPALVLEQLDSRH